MSELDVQCARAMNHLEPFIDRPIPCPDNKPGCCVMHYGQFDSAGVRLPNYSTDPAAARLLEDEIARRGLQERYIGWFYKHVCTDGMNSRQEVFAILRATSEQKARAFLEAVRR